MQPKPSARLLAAMAALIAGAAQAQNIDTTTAWDGVATVDGFGGTLTTFGQTITVPAGHDKLTGFSVYIDAGGSSRPFRAAVYAWSAAQQRAVGPALWQSEPITVAGASGTVLEYPFAPPGGVPVTPGQRYVLLGTTLYDTGSGSMGWGWMHYDAYSGGGFVYLGANSPADFTSMTWANTGARDSAFKATFAAMPPIQPVPGPPHAALALLGLALAGAAFPSTRLLRQGARKP